MVKPIICWNDMQDAGWLLMLWYDGVNCLGRIECHWCKICLMQVQDVGLFTFRLRYHGLLWLLLQGINLSCRLIHDLNAAWLHWLTSRASLQLVATWLHDAGILTLHLVMALHHVVAESPNLFYSASCIMDYTMLYMDWCKFQLVVWYSAAR